jgi:hypothetical protein
MQVNKEKERVDLIPRNPRDGYRGTQREREREEIQIEKPNDKLLHI